MPEFDPISYAKASRNERTIADYVTYEGKKLYIFNPYKNGGFLSLKGQLHCHSNNSHDGHQPPAEMVEAYKNVGYDFISLTEHDVITPDPGVNDIIFIQGVEETKSRHVTAYNVTTMCGETLIQSIIDFHRANSNLCSIAHPAWSSRPIQKDEMSYYYDYNFTEVYNASVTDRNHEECWDYALSAGSKVFGMAVDDCHDITGDRFNKGWVVVFADTKDKNSILQSLRDGNFYASTGNDISISIDGNTITATSSEDSDISFIGINGKILQTDSDTQSATYTIKGDELYIRVKSVKVSDDTIAWSQPIFIDTIGGDSRQIASRTMELTGTWTPVISGGTFQYSSQIGTFIKIGRLVVAFFNLRVSSVIEASTGNFSITNLPYVIDTPTSQRGGASISEIHHIELSTGYSQFGLRLQENGSTAYLMESGDNVEAQVVNGSRIKPSSTIVGCVTYIAKPTVS